jgi:hypothetical protein
MNIVDPPFVVMERQERNTFHELTDADKILIGPSFLVTERGKDPKGHGVSHLDEDPIREVRLIIMDIASNITNLDFLHWLAGPIADISHP